MEKILISSKAMAEFSIKAYMQIIRNDKKLIKNLSISIEEAGNVIGGADWAKNRLVPDCMHGQKEEAL